MYHNLKVYGFFVGLISISGLAIRLVFDMLAYRAGVVLTRVTTGLSTAALTKLLEFVQQLTWRGSGTNILDAAQHASPRRHIAVLAGAGIVTGLGQIILKRLSSANVIDTTAAIWFHAGRMSVVRTLGSTILSVIIVGMGVSLGREGAPRQAGSVAANLISDWRKLSDEQRRLLVACGAGAGLGSAYGFLSEGRCSRWK